MEKLKAVAPRSWFYLSTLVVKNVCKINAQAAKLRQIMTRNYFHLPARWKLHEIY